MLGAGRNGALGQAIALVVDAAGAPRDAMILWMTGVLSAFLDNAPTYLVFFNLAGGDAIALMGPLKPTLKAISMGAVYFGALTYIGNAPNFMIKAIAEDRGVAMPSFFAYFGCASLVLLPLLAVITAAVCSRSCRALYPSDEDVDAERSVRAEHDRLLDVAGARGPGDHVHRARQLAPLAANQRERFLHAGDDAIGADDGDVRIGQKRRRRRRVGAGEHDERAGFGDRAERAGDAETVVARRRPRLDVRARRPPSRDRRTRASRRRHAISAPRCAAGSTSASR